MTKKQSDQNLSLALAIYSETAADQENRTMIASPIKDSHSQLVHNKSTLEHSLNLSNQYKLNSTTAMNDTHKQQQSNLNSRFNNQKQHSNHSNLMPPVNKSLKNSSLFSANINSLQRGISSASDDEYSCGATNKQKTYKPSK